MDIFSHTDLKTNGIDSLENEFNKAFSQRFSTIQYKFNPDFLYRGRPNWDGKNNKPVDLFDNISELWAPPECKDLQQGRCNKPGQSLFYATQNCSAILFELDCKPEQVITIGVYKCRGEMYPLGIVGAKKISLIDQQHYKIFSNHYNALSEQGKEIHNYVDTLFQAETSEYYNATNAITSIFLNDNSNLSELLGVSTPDNFMGLIYSSVATLMNTYNIVLQPEYAKTILTPIEFHRYKIQKRQSVHPFTIELTHSSSGIELNGKINWVERKPHIIENI